MSQQEEFTPTDIFPKNLLEAMKEKGWTQAQLGDASGLAQGTISNYLRGKREPTSGQLYVLSQALGVTMEWLLHDHPVRSLEKWVAKIEHALNEPIGDRLLAELREDIRRSDAKTALNFEKQGKSDSEDKLQKLNDLLPRLAENLQQANHILGRIQKLLK